MKRLIAFCILPLLISPAAAENKPELIGHYSNMVTSHDDDPHFLAGYDLSLYSQNNRPYGSLHVATGAEEPLGARLRDITFNARTRKLTFMAEFSQGWEANANTYPTGLGAHPVLRFSGKIASRSVVGRFTVSDLHCIVCSTKVIKVVLKRSAETVVLEEQFLPSL